MIGCSLATSAWRLGNLGRARRFRRALGDPGAAQRRLLKGYLERHAGTDFGRRHGFAEIRTLADWRRRVPLADYDDIQPLVERIRGGEGNVLTAEPVTRLVPSSGSTAARKLVPMTAGLGEEFNRAIGPWIVDLFRRHPCLGRGRAYWSISPAIEIPEDVASAVPVGFEDDGAYLGFFQSLVERTLAVPGAVRHLGDLEAFRYATLLHLLQARDLTLISVWHPSFLTLLLEPLARWWERLVADVGAGALSLPEPSPPGPLSQPTRPPPGRGGDPMGSSPRIEVRRPQLAPLRPDRRRAAELSRLGPGEPAALWPNLKVISCWADGHAAAPAAELGERFLTATVEPKGLVATEAFVSLPLAGSRPLAVSSHFFEFLDDRGRPHLAGELKDGGEYSLAVTTGGGLYRYRLHDRVRLEGRLAATPCLRFLGKEDRVSDRCGEKLSEGHVAGVLERLLAAAPGVRFAMLAPDEAPGGASGYTLYLESRRPPPEGLAGRLGEALAENPHFRYAVDLGQLRPPRLFRVAGGAHHVYLEHLRRSGQRLGDVKPAALHPESGWSTRFTGRYEQ